MLERRMTVTVIGGTLVTILEDFVGLVDFLEANLAGGIARIPVRVPFHCQLAKSGLEARVIRGTIDFKGFVIATLGGHPSNPPEFCLIPRSIPKQRVSKDVVLSFTKNNPRPSRRAVRSIRRGPEPPPLSRLLLVLVFVDFGEFGIDDVVLR